MKTFRFISILLAAVAVLTSCNEDVVIDNPVVVNTTPDDELVVEIDGDNSQRARTRVAYSGWATSFETGDQIGIYCWNGTSVVASNVPFTKQSNGTWTTATNTRVPYNASYTYFCYFPYNASHGYTPGTSGNADTRFATFITDASNRFWKADQSTKANYDASNLMIGAGSHVGSGNKVRFAMDHKRGMAVFTDDAVAATFTGKIPYLIDEKMYFLMKPSTSTEFTDDMGTYSLTAAAGKYVVKQIKRYFCTILEETGTVQLKIPANVNTSYMTSVSYSTDNGLTWTTTNNSSTLVTITTPSLSKGTKVLWKGSGLSMAKSTGNNNFSNFTTSSANFSIRGNIMSLLFGDDFVGQKDLSTKGAYSFYRLFQNNTKIKNIDGLIMPATTLVNNCYREMFSGCTNLKLNDPNIFHLPATTLTNYCYCAMFEKCTGLTTAPELPATTLAEKCYNGMFRYCSGLTTTPELPATTLATSCYYDMFRYCSGLTTTTKLPATTLANECYNYMFAFCTALTTAPELPATTLATGCYGFMFDGCTSLRYIKMLATNISASNCLSFWVRDVRSSGTFVKAASMTTLPSGESGIPAGWTVQNAP